MATGVAKDPEISVNALTVENAGMPREMERRLTRIHKCSGTTLTRSDRPSDSRTPCQGKWAPEAIANGATAFRRWKRTKSGAV